VRVLFSSTANDGHFGPLLPFARACAASGNEVRVAAPASYAGAVARVGLPHEPFADAPSELIGPLMATLPTLSPTEADEVVVREVFGRVDAQAALPSLIETIGRWRPDVVVRESAELGSLAAAQRMGVPHVQVCIGMHEVVSRFAEVVRSPLEELGRMAGLSEDRTIEGLADEPVLSLVPELLDHPSGAPSPGTSTFERFHEPVHPGRAARPPAWGDPDRPLVYVTFGSVTGSLPPFVGVFREALDALADLDATVVMTVGRGLDPEDLGPWPTNAQVVQWLPQDDVLAHATAMLGHGGFGTTMGALAAGVPQVVTPLFSFDQAVNGAHVAAVGAGVTTDMAPGAVAAGAAEVQRLLKTPSYAESARSMADALREMRPPSEAVPVLRRLAR
jgi:hypothetical protein